MGYCSDIMYLSCPCCPTHHCPQPNTCPVNERNLIIRQIMIRKLSPLKFEKKKCQKVLWQLHVYRILQIHLNFLPICISVLFVVKCIGFCKACCVFASRRFQGFLLIHCPRLIVSSTSKNTIEVHQTCQLRRFLNKKKKPKQQSIGLQGEGIILFSKQSIQTGTHGKMHTKVGQNKICCLILVKLAWGYYKSQPQLSM